MKHVTRTLQATMAACLLGASLLAGCGAPATSDGASSDAAATAASSDASDASDVVVDDGGTDVYDSASMSQDFPVGEHVDMDQVLYDENGIKVTATGFGPVSLWAALNIDVENTGDREVDVWAERSTLNGWTWDAALVGLDDGRYEEGLQLTLKPGETRSCGIGFSNTYYLKPCDIEAFSQIGFVFGIFDTETGERVAQTPLLVADIPGNEGYVQKYDDAGAVAYEDGGIRVIVRDVTKDSIDEYALPVYVENLSDKYIAVSPASMSVDGKPMDEETAYRFAEAGPGLRAVGNPRIEGLSADSKVEISFRIVELDPVTSEEIGDVATTGVVSIGA